MADTLIAVISYNNCFHTKRTVDALLRQTHRPDIVVWDNNSPDGSGAVLARAYAHVDGVRVHRAPENRLWSPAINQVFLRYVANHSYLGFMNNDITLPPHALTRMLYTLQLPKVGLVAPMGSCLGGAQDWATHMGSRVPTENVMIGLPTKRATYTIGACVLLPLKVWYDVGPLDEDMPLGADDHDYSIRVKKAGYKIWVNQNVYADHAGHASGGAPEWGIWNQRGWDTFNKKWDGYFHDEEEAIKCHWGGTYHPGWDVGTGWMSADQRQHELSLRN